MKLVSETPTFNIHQARKSEIHNYFKLEGKLDELTCKKVIDSF